MKHDNSTMQEGGKSGIPIGAFALGALAGALAGILLAPKAGKEMREDIKDTLANMRDEITERLSELKDVTQEKYHSIVDAVIESYKATKELTDQQAREIKSDLERGYNDIREAAGRIKG